MSDYQMCVIIAFIFLARSVQSNVAFVFAALWMATALMFKLAEIYQ